MKKDATFVRRVVLRNYKSIASCDVQLGPLNFLVGPNGSGKSNFLDSLRFVTDGLNTSLDHALRDRGGIDEVRRRSSGHPNHFSIQIDFVLENGRDGSYFFRIGARPRRGYEVQEEVCKLFEFFDKPPEFYVISSGEIKKSSVNGLPPAMKDRLSLVRMSSVPEFRPVYDALSHMGFYNLNPDVIRGHQSPDAGEVLRRDGGNLASILNQLIRGNVEVKERIEDYLSKVVPGITGVDFKQLGTMETLEFRQEVGRSQHPWRFNAANMSDGTLRAFGILVALFQGRAGAPFRVPLVGIEEPELALHPAAAEVLRDSLRDASDSTQVIVTSHSPELLDDSSLSDKSILPVVCEQGQTRIGPLDEAGRSAIRDRLYTPGELLRMNQLAPEAAGEDGAAARQEQLPLQG